MGNTQLLERPVPETTQPPRRGRWRFALRELSPLLAIGVAAVVLVVVFGVWLAWAQTPASIRTAAYRAPDDCLPVELLGPNLQVDLPTGMTLDHIVAIQSDYPGYESLFYIAAAVQTDASTQVALWAANFYDGSYRAAYASFVPVNEVARGTGISVGGLEPPKSDPAAAEALSCAR